MYQKLYLQFQILMHRHFFIASFFESIKYIHQIGLWSILPSAEYGLVGTLFSLAYLSANICSLETGTAILACITTHKTHNITKSLIKNLITKPLIQHVIGALCVIIYTKHYTSLSLAYITGAITCTEGMRITIRPVLYASSTNTQITKVEALMSSCYIAFIWLSLLLTPHYITATYILGWYAIVSASALSYLLLQGHTLIKAYQKSVSHLPCTSIQGLSVTQQSLLLLHLPHHLFSANFLVPFFANHISLQFAGIIKITSELSSALKTILKSSISFPIHTLILQYTKHSQAITKHLINTITLIDSRIIKWFYSTILICSTGVGIYTIIKGCLPPESIILFFGFSILTSADYLCMPYELLSLYRKRVLVAAFIRGIEVLCNITILVSCTKYPTLAICSIASIRFMTWRVLKYESESAPPSFLQD